MTTRADQGCCEYMLSEFLRMRDELGRTQDRVIELQGRLFSGDVPNELVVLALRDAVRTRWAGVKGDKDKSAARNVIRALNKSIIYFGGTREEVGG